MDEVIKQQGRKVIQKQISNNPNRESKKHELNIYHLSQAKENSLGWFFQLLIGEQPHLMSGICKCRN